MPGYSNTYMVPLLHCSTDVVGFIAPNCCATELFCFMSMCCSFFRIYMVDMSAMGINPGLLEPM